MKYLLSVDGGGTKTLFAISDIDGNEIGKVQSGSSNYKSVGVEVARDSLCVGFEKLKEQYKITNSDIAYSVWGISGCDSEEDFDILMEVIRHTGLTKEQILLCNDGLLAYYAQAAEPGVVIIAGTGSIVLGVKTDGTTYRSGGWGNHISDIGSGYWIGSEAIKRTLLYCDECEAYTPLYDAIRQQFGAKNFKQLPFILTGVTDCVEVAKVAKTVVELGENGEEQATEILKEGARVLAKMTVNIHQKLGLKAEEHSSIVFSGGVLKSQIYQMILKEAILQELDKKNEKLKSNVEFTMQKNDPVFGGIRLAQVTNERRGRGIEPRR